MADKLFRYIGPADERSFVKEDFRRHGVDDQDDVVFNRANAKTAPLSTEAAKLLAKWREPFMMPEDQKQAQRDIDTAYAAAVAQEEALVGALVAEEAEGAPAAEDGPPSGSAGSVATDAGTSTADTASGGTAAKSNVKSTDAKSKA